VAGTRNVARACLKHEIRKIIFVSTPSIYYTGEHRLDIREDDPLPRQQASHYAETKLEAETELAQLRRQGIRVITFRPRAVYGPHDHTILPRILDMAKRPRFPLIAGGEALVDITYVDNFADAVSLALRAPKRAWNETYNISNGRPIRMREFFARVLQHCGRPFRPLVVPEAAAWALGVALEGASHLPFGPREPPFTRFTVGYTARSMTLNIDKARRLLGWTPRLSNAEGFVRLGAWFARHGRPNG
jgi:nucleoside-diphosphate-sugar epimerase